MFPIYRHCKAAYASHFTAGKKYYIEAIHKESYGEDFIKVGVREPNGRTRLLTDADMKWALTGMLFKAIRCDTIR